MKAIQTNNQGGKLSSKFSLKNSHYIKLTSSINKTGLLSAFTFLLLALTCLFPISKGEQNTEAVTGTVQSSSLTLNVSNSAASVELDVNSMAGTFASSTTDNSATFSVVTNNFSGYTLSISGSDDEGKLYDSSKQNFLSSLTSATTETDFASTSGTDLNGKWGYKPSKFNSAVNEDFLPAPTTEASTIDTTVAANTTANDYSISLGLRADYTTLADTYTNTFTIIAVPNPIAYVITYDANTTDTVSNMPAAQNSTTSATSIILSDKAPTRENYDFKGWCTVASTAANPDACSGTTYQPGDTYGIDQTSENITVLYAMWKKQTIYIQDYTYAQCSAEATDAPVTVIDKRDDKEYTVRYINGLCTMTKNLDFELTTGMTLSPDTTNVAASTTLGTVGSLTSGSSYTEARTARNSYIADAGLHYNYCAATAGEICTSSNNTEATQDVCPAGWRLPTGDSTGEQFILNNSYTFGSWNANYPTEFSPVAAGFYDNSSLSNSGSYGYWWSSSAVSSSSPSYRYSLSYNASSGLSSGYYYRYGVYLRGGLSVRCLKAKPGVTISFNANGGSGTMDMQKIDAEQSTNLTANTFTRTDYVFAGWNTKADGTGTAYADTALYTAPASEDNKIVVLYAQWGKYVGDMQNYTSATQCSIDATDAPAFAADARDGKLYSIRYINGICTMTQNLDFELASGMTLSPDTTNVKSTKTMGTVGALSSGNTSTEARTATSSTSGYGTYYNYCAATAGEICVISSAAEATEDVCPAGWRLPTGNTGQEQTLLTNGLWQTYDTTFQTAFSPVAAGYYDSGSLRSSGTYGYWWSSTASNTSLRYHLFYYTSNGLYSGNYYYRRLGYSVRCVLGS